MLGFNWAFDWIERERHREEKRCRAPTGSWTLCHWPFFPPSFPSARARRACAWPCTRMKEPTDRPDIDVVSAREKSSTKHSVPRDYLSGPAKAAGKMRRLILSQEPPPLLTRRRSRVNCLFFFQPEATAGHSIPAATCKWTEDGKIETERVNNRQPPLESTQLFFRLGYRKSGWKQIRVVPAT